MENYLLIIPFTPSYLEHWFLCAWEHLDGKQLWPSVSLGAARTLDKRDYSMIID